MTWGLPLARSGGTAGSQGGHETRRHRLRGALFASVFASVLLAACGGGSGGNDANIVNEPRPPKQTIGSLVSTGEQQEIIIVNQEDQGQGQEGQQQVHQEREPEGQQGQGEPEGQQGQGEPAGQQGQGEPAGQQGQGEPAGQQGQGEPAGQQGQGEPEGQQGQGEPEGQQGQGEPEGQQQKIVVNTQSDNQESEEEENNNNEETPQQLTIVEEEDFPHVPPEEEEPRYSEQTTSVSFPDRHQDADYKTETYEVVGSIGDFSYWLEDAPNTDTDGSWKNRTLSVEFLKRNKKIDPYTEYDANTGQGATTRIIALPSPGILSLWNTLLNSWGKKLGNDGDYLTKASDQYDEEVGKSRQDRIIASYNKENGFVGAYIYKGEVGSFQSDVNLEFIFWPNQYGELERNEGSTKPRIVGTIGNDLVMGGDDFRGFIVNSELDVSRGTFEITEPQFGYDGGLVQADGSRVVFWEHIYSGEGTITGALSNDGTEGHTPNELPNYLAGEVKVTGFSKNGESGAGNQLVGAFVGDKKSAFNDN